MCKSCNGFTWNTGVVFEGTSMPDVVTSSQIAAIGAAYEGTSASAAVPDNYQPVESAWYLPGATALIDSYTAAPNTAGTLVVDGAHVMAASDTPGDNDWFAVTLTAGQTYEFGQYARAGGIPGAEGSGIPLADAYLEIYDSAGNLLSIADGGGPNTPSGLDALMTFEATYSGTYYVNATSYDNTGDGAGDFIGDYEIFARTATGTFYTTPYDISSPLHSIDWGGVMVNREHVSVRNPDGMEGPRPTGQPAADPATVEGNALGHPGKNVVYLYFAGEGDLYANADSTIPAQVVVQNPYQYEVQAMLTAANEFSKVADVVFVSNYTLNASTGLYERDPTIVYKPGPLGVESGMKYATGVDGDGFDADFFYFSYPGTPGPGISLLGSMNPPDNGDEGVAQFNSADERWNAQMLQPGGFSFVTLIHEFGHGMGLAHPHDTGGGSSIMQGVVPGTIPGEDGGAGAFDLNQGVYTMMSYNDGWAMSPYGQPETNNEGYGWLSSLMALDIAVIQDKYGVNEEWATGNDTYVLKDVNEWGVYIDSATGQPAAHDPTNQLTARDGYYVGESTSYSSIWDAGGVDEIVYNGAKDTNIDLRPATLKYEYGGGGWMSYATGIFGGFTVANGVTIENATSGSGNDTLTGNAANNVLTAGAGNDVIRIDGGGNDTVVAGDGVDSIYAGGAFTAGDTIDGGTNRDALILQGNYASGVTFGTGTTSNITGVDSISLFAGNNTTYGDTANNSYSYNLTLLDGNVAQGAVMKVNGFFLRTGENLTFNAAAETDGSFQVLAGHGVDTLTGGAQGDTFVFGHDYRFGGGDTVNGGGGYDVVYLRGDYVLDFTAEGFVGSLSNIESIGLLTSANNEFAGGGDGEFDYSIVAGDWMVATGATLTVNGSRLGANETFIFDGSQESGGHYRIFGGAAADAFNGGAGNDFMQGGGGADRMRGYAGADTFRFASTSDSTAANTDQILDFYSRLDTIDLQRIDAIAGTEAEDAFTFIGSGAFSGAAGELRATNVSGNLWRVEGDVTGDGIADLVIDVTVENGLQLVATDFLV
ncbi:MAG TPA: M10 family metallopeptidase C-terminal domain-containing protein [Allosphingosinicella sp.]|jgi:serralysin